MYGQLLAVLGSCKSNLLLNAVVMALQVIARVVAIGIPTSCTSTLLTGARIIINVMAHLEYNLIADFSKKRDVNSLLTKIEQDDEILKELDNKLRTSSRRTFIDGENVEEGGEKSSSLPSLNSFGGSEWKKVSKNDHETSYESYRKDSGALLPLLLIDSQY